MAHGTCTAVAFMLASVVVQASQCSSGSGCASDKEPQNAVSLLQTKLQMNALKDGGEEVYGPYPHKTPLIDYFKNWARGGVRSHFKRMLEHDINPELLQLGTLALTEAEATMAFSASVEAECPESLAAMHAVAPFSIVHSEPAGDDGLRHVLLKSKAGQLQYLATHRQAKGNVRAVVSDPPLCRVNGISAPSLLEQELPSVDPGALHSGQDSAGEAHLLDLDDDSVLDCIALFHRTVLDSCHKTFELHVQTARASIIDGLRIHLTALVCHEKSTDCRLHTPECNFETQADHTDASFLQSGGEPDTLPGNTIKAEEAGLTATLTLHVPLCDCDVTDGVNTTDHVDAGLMETLSFGENSRYKGHEHDNDDLPKWSALEVQTGQTPTDIDFRISFPSCFPAIPSRVAGTEVVRNQGTCGSCWAFAGATTAMTNLCTSTNSVSANTHNGDADRMEVSVQKIMSCKATGASTQNGCLGGNMNDFTKTANLWGLTAEKDNLYRCGGGNALNHFTQTSSNCDAYPWDGHCSGTPRADWFWGGSASVSGADAMVTFLQNGFSLYATIAVYSNFMSWGNQIYTRHTGRQLGGHSVNLMGYGKDAGTKYWLVQNSWGTDHWGNNGFGRVLRGTNLLGIETEAYVTRVWLQGGTPAPCIDSNDGTGLSQTGHPPYIPCSQALGHGNLCTRYPTAAQRCMSTCSRCDGTNGANAPPSPPTPGQAPAPSPSFSTDVPEAYTVESLHWCSNSDNRELWNGGQGTMQECALAVNADTECSSTFYGKLGLCSCVATGGVCQEAASSYGNSIYRQAYELVNSGHWCSNSDQKELWNGGQGTLQECALAMNADTECSSTFYGKVGLCSCVAKGSICQQAASSYGNSIYRQAYELVKSGHWCSNSDHKQLWNGAQGTLQDCALAVNADTECSSTFYGKVGLCSCVATGGICQEAASSYGNSIYQATTTA